MLEKDRLILEMNNSINWIKEYVLKVGATTVEHSKAKQDNLPRIEKQRERLTSQEIIQSEFLFCLSTTL